MPIESTVRVRRPSAAVLALQGAKGTPVDDFRLTSGGVRLWTRRASVPAGTVKNSPRWMDSNFADSVFGRIGLRQQIDGEVLAVATPENLLAILKNHWGPMAGTPKASTLAAQVNQYASLLWIEDQTPGSTQKLIRLRDVFLYRLGLLANRKDHVLLISGAYAARANENVPIASPGAIQFTPAPMTPDARQYAVRSASFVYDYAGFGPVPLDWIDLEITLDQQVNSEWTHSDGWDVWKRGKTLVHVKIVSKLTDEYWQMIANSNASSSRRFRLTATSDGSPQSTLTIDLFGIDWEFEPIGHREDPACLLEANGRAFLTSGTPESGFVKFSIS